MKREQQASFARAIGRALRTFVTERLKGLVTREELETRLGSVVGQPGPVGPAGRDGKDGEVPDIAPIIRAAIDNLPHPQNGRDGIPGTPGRDGKDGLTPDVAPIIAAVLEKIPRGRDGKDGERGLPGESIKGDPGESIIGPVGPQGIQGERGQDGQSIKGDQGERGNDAEPLDPAPIIQEVTVRLERKVEAEVARVASLVQPVRDGKDGKDAPPISRELLLEMVTGEVNRFVATIPIPKDGRDGRDAREPVDGRDGAPGRDASEIEIVRSVEEDRKYRRGTLGIVNRSICVSTGDAWDELIPAPRTIAGIKFEKVERVNTLLVDWSDGHQDVHTAKSNEMIYRDVWVAREYERGDVVTHSGSTWHCQALKTRAKPGTGGDWKLCNKRGADGKAFNGDKDNPFQELLSRIAVLETRLATIEKPAETPKPEVPAPSPVALTINHLPSKVSRTKKSGNVKRQPDGTMRFEIEEEHVEEKDGTEHQDG